MKITDILLSSEKPFPSFEIVPPQRGIRREELFASISPLLEFKPKFINVTCHREEVSFRQEADGSFSRHLTRRNVSEVAVCASVIEHFGVEVVPHIICAGATPDQIESLLEDFSFMGIENVMALRGDSALGEKRFSPTPGGFAHASELVAAIRSFEKREGKSPFCIGVGGYPEKHVECANLPTDIKNLKKKVDEGADYIVTQMFFDNSVFYRFVRLCREAGITVPIIPGIKPLSTLRHLNLLPESFSIDIPLELSREVLANRGDKDRIYEIGTLWAISQTKDLLRNGVPAVHFYTMGKANNIARIVEQCF